MVHNLKTGSGKDVYIDVPLGTIVRDDESEEVLEITDDGEEKILQKGGRGGSNNHFNQQIKPKTCSAR